MKKDSSHKSLKELFQDVEPNFFTECENDLKPFRISNISNDSLFIEVPVDINLKENVKGFLLSEKGYSVIEFLGRVVREKPSSKTNRVLQIVANQETFQRINRRISPRVSFNPPIPLSVVDNETGNVVHAYVNNMGAGGLCFQSKEDIKTSDLFIFNFELECEGAAHQFSIPGKIVGKIPVGTSNLFHVKFIMHAGDAQGRKITRDMADNIIKLSSLIIKLTMRFPL